MANMHYSELFYSIQGEGKYQGVPSIFLRMFGCNFRCKNFGRYEKDILGIDETHNPEVIEIIKNIDQYNAFKDLPLVKTGCDSYTSIYPEFKKFVIKTTPDKVAKQIMELLPFNKWKQEHLVITGGEPLLGWQRSYPELLQQPEMKSLKEITFETNGTQELHTSFIYFLKDWIDTGRSYDSLTFSVSPKLSCSGEDQAVSIRPDIICQYQDVGFTYLKFVIATEDDCNEALETINTYQRAGFSGPIYLMPVGGVESVYTLNNKNVALMAMKHGLRYSDRLQVPLFKNAWAT